MIEQFGWMLQDGKVVENPKEQEALRLLESLHQDGHSYRAIAQELYKRLCNDKILPNTFLVARVWCYLVNDVIKKKDIDKVCWACGVPSYQCEVHHIIPKSLGGPKETWNEIFLCRTCHDFLDRRRFQNIVDIEWTVWCWHNKQMHGIRLMVLRSIKLICIGIEGIIDNEFLSHDDMVFYYYKTIVPRWMSLEREYNPYAAEIKEKWHENFHYHKLKMVVPSVKRLFKRMRIKKVSNNA